MKKTCLTLIIFISIFTFCTGSKEQNQRLDEWIGRWNAEWKTPPASYPELRDMKFLMTGEFIFTTDSLTVINHGYPNCIFAVDTLEHTQTWAVSNDSLILYNKESIPGMVYKVESFSDNVINLKLMEDIFVTLTQ